MKSVMSFPERGNYGKSSWRGNTSGYVIKGTSKNRVKLQIIL